MTNPRSTPQYQAWRTKVLTQCEPVCIRCGYPVDMTLKGSHPDGPSADHEPPLAITGEATPSLDGAGIAHLSCNRSHGGRLGSQRAQANAQAKRNGKPATKTETRSLSKALLTPAAPRFLPPIAPETALEGLVRPEFHPEGFILPRLESVAPERARGSYGVEAEEWLGEHFDMSLLPWQRYALNRILEHDEYGNLVWPSVLLTVGRQQGKSTLTRAMCLWRLHHAHLFGETQTILHIANTTPTALEVMRPAGQWAVEKYGKKATRWGNTAPQIELPSGDRWLVRAANQSAGVGYSISMIFVDEAFLVKRSVIEDSVMPTMSKRLNPQLIMTSTAGDSTSDLMISYRQRAIDKLESPDPGSVLLLEWSAPPQADMDDPASWVWGSPDWDQAREDFLRRQWENIEPEAFRRQFLNQWTAKANHWLKDRWWAQTQSDLQLPQVGVWSVALESDFDGMGHAVAVAAPVEDRIVVRVTTHRTIKEADEQLAKIRAGHPSLFVQVTPGYVDRLTQRFDELVGQREAAAATQNLLDLFDRRAFAHDNSPVLLEHFYNSNISRRQGGWVLTAPMGRGGVYAARAVLFAAAQASKTPKPMAMIRSRRRA